MKLFPRRALVALGTVVASLGATFAFAPAAHAVTTMFTGAYGNGNGYIYISVGEDSNLNTFEDVVVSNYQHDGVHCVEAVVDIPLNQHRPADLFPDCTGTGFDTGWLPLHWGRNSPSGYGNPVQWQAVTGQSPRIALCDTDVVPTDIGYLARNTTHCAGTSLPGVITNQDWTGLSWWGISNIYCGSGCSADLRPEYENRGRIDLEANTILNPGDMQVSWDATHRMVMQGDGNFVLYNYNNAATWAASWCGAHLVAGNHAIIQSDGNIVLRDPANNVQWSDVNDSTCAHGGWGGAGPYSIMQNDGNYVVYQYAGGPALWWTGTNGR